MTPAAYNAAASRRLWPQAELPAPLPSLDPGSEEFAAAVEAYQSTHGLIPDGHLGPVTWARMRRDATPAPAWPLTDGWRPSRVHRRTLTPRCIVIHDTVSHAAKPAFRTLERHGYATHAFVDLDGTVLWCVDPASEYGAHAGAFNAASVGIDVVSILDPSLANAAERKRIVPATWSASKVEGRAVAWTEAQQVAVVALVRLLCDRLAIPHFVPAELTGYGRKIATIRAETFRGVVAHGQVSRERWDGLHAPPLLAAAGFETE